MTNNKNNEKTKETKNKDQKEKTEKNQINFTDFELDKNIIKAITEKGFTKPTEIQEKSIPIILENKNDIVGIAQTGTGKTAAFGLGILTNVKEKNKYPKCIILSPTRELALQISEELESYKGKKKINITTVYGGQRIDIQLKDLKKGTDIIVGTPGRVIDLLKRKALNLKEIDYLVLDEADEMLKMGFVDDVEKILAQSKEEKKVYLYSATMPDAIKSLTKKYMNKQKIIETKNRKETPKNIEQIFYKVKRSDKLNLLTQLIEIEDFFYGIIFCKTRRDVDELTKSLRKCKLKAGCIHGEITQNKREKILNEFKEQKLNILIATDVAARGIDVDSLSHVINFSFPQELETYVHRIGRTARAGKKGTAITLVSPAEMRKVSLIEKILGTKLTKGKFPNKQEIINKKKQRIQNEILETLNKETKKNKENPEYKELIDKLLEKETPITIINALIHKLFGKDFLNPKFENTLTNNNNRQKDEFSQKDDSRRNRQRRNLTRTNSDEIRLFVARGTLDKIDKTQLINMLEKKSKLKLKNFKNVKICDKFSFITLNKQDGLKVLKSFKSSKGKPLVEQTKN